MGACDIIKYVCLAVSIALAVISWIVAFVKAKRTGNKQGILDLFEQIPKLVEKAEMLFGSGTGTAKLNYVLTELRLFAFENHIKVDKEQLEQQVENVVDATKNVNVTATQTEIKES